MHTSTKELFLYAILLLVCATSCEDVVKSTHTFHAMTPVYLEMSDVRARTATIMPSQPLDSPGKIYIYGDYLFVNEPMKGIHILDNRDPANPVNKNFIAIEGNIDLAINDNMLYADSYVDLLVFDISKINNIKLVKRVEDVFPSLYTSSGIGVILTFKDTVITREFNPTTYTEELWFSNSSDGFSKNYSNAASNYGVGGSMARFTLLDDHLYTVNESTLRVFDVSKASEPTFIKPIDLGWGIETIFPFENKLFIGSNRGMHIYDASTPSSPTRMSVFEHVLACDPVVVNKAYAFVTLRSGNTCVNNTNQLQVIDIEDPYAPKLAKAYDMLNPHGLGLAGNYLYLAEGQHGLKSFDISDVLNIDKNQLEFLESMKSVDLIPGPKSLIVIGPDGVCQFDYSNPAKLQKLSCIQVTNPVAF